MSNLLLTVLLINAAIVGAISTVAIRHAREHFRPTQPAPAKTHPTTAVKLPPEVRQAMLERAEAGYQRVLDAASAQLQMDLSRTGAKLSSHLESLGVQLVDDELTRYRANLDALQKRTEAAVGLASGELERQQATLEAGLRQRQTELEAAMAQKMKTEVNRLLAAMDTKLSDAILSFLFDHLGENIDLGAQTPYLVKLIEQHKDELKKEVKHA